VAVNLNGVVTAILPWSTPTAAPANPTSGSIIQSLTNLYTASQAVPAEAGADPTTVIVVVTITGNTAAPPVTMLLRAALTDMESYPVGTTFSLAIGAPVAPVANQTQG
jgi:hypothetical protein